MGTSLDEDVFRRWCVYGNALHPARRAKVDKKHGWIGHFIYKQFDGRISKKRDLICKVKFGRLTEVWQQRVLSVTTWGRKQNALTL